MPERWRRKTHAPGAPRGHSGIQTAAKRVRTHTRGRVTAEYSQQEEHRRCTNHRDMCSRPLCVTVRSP
eukprot:5037744-Prymnesium_polylepis.1